MKSALYDVAMYTHRHSWKGSQREGEREGGEGGRRYRAGGRNIIMCDGDRELKWTCVA